MASTASTFDMSVLAGSVHLVLLLHVSLAESGKSLIHAWRVKCREVERYWVADPLRQGCVICEIVSRERVHEQRSTPTTSEREQSCSDPPPGSEPRIADQGEDQLCNLAFGQQRLDRKICRSSLCSIVDCGGLQRLPVSPACSKRGRETARL